MELNTGCSVDDTLFINIPLEDITIRRLSEHKFVVVGITHTKLGNVRTTMYYDVTNGLRSKHPSFPKESTDAIPPEKMVWFLDMFSRSTEQNSSTFINQAT